MRFQINKLIESNSLESSEQFCNELNEWLTEKGYTTLQHQLIELPNGVSSPIKIGGSTAVFHSNYNAGVTSLTTYRRYFLSRTWNSSLPVMTLFGMNPSNASINSNDPTVEFMLKVAEFNDCGSLYVVNTSPYIKSSQTRRADFVIDDEAWEYIKYAVNHSDIVVLAWGENGQKYGIPTIINNYPLRGLLARNSQKLRVFEFGGINSTRKFPKHPLQIPPNDFQVNHRLLTPSITEFNDLFPY
ncbi:DUF1643 domain-containing protein [Ureibacillus acetophenoni]|uniref:Uncharacterized protein DUF1643 n=1 Tax=Ureibacillus acetophenoni TaxID=614649 RepID=A0A285UJ54_9BACL|nr:DUF1643 domain-containing protein [Ureibacillus acetophenoni]SOC40281.1 uncharacterized protein DUF1643 [Ureibacillus acetophenoni]